MDTTENLIIIFYAFFFITDTNKFIYCFFSQIPQSVAQHGMFYGI